MSALKRTFECTVEDCPYKCARARDLGTHERLHDLPHFECLVEGCGYLCPRSQSGQFNVHKRIRHTLEKPFSCDYDGCTFLCNQSGNLTAHKITHTATYECKFHNCGESFIGKAAIDAHRETHKGSKPFTCDVEGCSFASDSQAGLTVHQLIHSGDKPFSCDLCDYACTQSVHLEVHMRTHTGEKPYSCDHEGCTYSCTTNSALTIHKRIHSHYYKLSSQAAEAS